MATDTITAGLILTKIGASVPRQSIAVTIYQVVTRDAARFFFQKGAAPLSLTHLLLRHEMTLSQKIKNSLRLKFRKAAPVQPTRPFVSVDAPTVELVRVEFPPIKARMVRCEGARKRGLFYENDFYSRF